MTAAYALHHEELGDLPLLDTLTLLRRLPPASRIADCGCFGWTLGPVCEELGHSLIGIDREEPPRRPRAARFVPMSGSTLHLPDDQVDLVVATHILEHLVDPTGFFGELARIVKPGGLVWIESPSELSALRPTTSDPTEHAFESFWDDPTHVRPWPPGALYRLALSRQCRPLQCGRGVTGGIPVSRLLARKPLDVQGVPPARFVSLKDVPPGLERAWRAVWPGTQGM